MSAPTVEPARARSQFGPVLEVRDMAPGADHRSWRGPPVPLAKPQHRRFPELAVQLLPEAFVLRL